jgi:MFS family permease
MNAATSHSTAEMWRYRGVRPLLAFSVLTSMAYLMQVTVLGAFVYQISTAHRELNLGLLGLAEFLPAALLVLVTGPVADRYDRRRVVQLAVAGEIVVAAALLAYVHAGHTAVAPILGIVFAFGIARAFMSPASRSMPAMIVPPEGLSALIPMYSMTWQLSFIIGPAVGGLLYDVGASTALAVVVAVIGLGLLVTLFMVPVPPRAEATSAGNSLRSALEGLVVVREHPLLLGAIALDLFAVLFGGAVALVPAVADQRLGVGGTGQGFLRAASGIGAALTALFLMVRPVRRQVGRKLLVSVAIFGVATIVFGMTHSYAVAFIAMFVVGASDLVSVFVRSTLVPLATPDHVRGRVTAVEAVFIGASNELGAFESGVAGSALGVGPSIVAGGLATLAIVGIWWAKFTALRDVDRFTDVVVHGAGPEPAQG